MTWTPKCYGILYKPPKAAGSASHGWITARKEPAILPGMFLNDMCTAFTSKYHSGPQPPFLYGGKSQKRPTHEKSNMSHTTRKRTMTKAPLPQAMWQTSRSVQQPTHTDKSRSDIFAQKSHLARTRTPPLDLFRNRVRSTSSLLR